VLSPYRRHTKSCRHFDKPNPQELTKCSCPVWCYGWINGKEIRKSMKMRDWKRALETADRWNKSLPDASPVVTVKEAVDAFVRHRRIRNMAESTIESHQKTFVHLVQFCGTKAINAVSLDMLTRFQESRIFTPNRKGSKPRAIQPSTINKELKTLRALFAFAAKRKWCEGNVAKDLEPAEDDGLPTLPFESAEISRILEACDRLDDGNPTTRDLNRRRARARILLMLHTGFRISDTVKLERKRVDLETGKLHIRIMKTRRPMYASLPASVIDALRALPDHSPYFFWSGKSKLRTAIGNARKSVSRVCRLAGIRNGHPHRFRDTFAIELLKNGATLHTVQLLLGHKSIRTTEKHYAPFVLEFQHAIDVATAKLSYVDRTKNRTISEEGHQTNENK
jgi:integrase/recombinase XerD